MIPNKNDPKYKEYKASPGVHKLIEDLYAYCDNLKEGEKGSEIKALEYTEARMIELRKLRVKYHEAGMQIITKDGENQLLMEQIKELKEAKSALKIAFNGKLATEKAACESRIKELQSQVELNYCQPCYDKLNKH
jgi:DNA repair ATPase RecN